MVKYPLAHGYDPLPVLEPKHCRAICNEIGDRLGQSMARDASPMPMRLRRLLDRFAELDGEAPSIVPDLEGDRPHQTDLKRRFTRRWR